MLVIVITFFQILIGLIKQLVVIFKNRNQLNWTFILPIVIYLIAIVIPIGSSESLESEVQFRACYEGTQNQATIKFRKDNTFELHSTGVFFSNYWYTGKWQQHEDVLKLTYDDKVVERLGNKLIIRDGYLVPLDASIPEAVKKRPMFYLGYCKGEN
jgi:hypothetical protein